MIKDGKDRDMPSRSRTVGPEASERLAEIVRQARLAKGLSMPGLSARMHDRGFELSAATINSIENGIALSKGRRTRLITVDELHAFIKALDIPAQAIVDWLYNE